MNVSYVDTSIFVTILLNEPNSKKYRTWVESADEMTSSNLFEAELLAVAKRENVGTSYAETFLEYVSLIYPDRSLRKEYRKLFDVGYCRGADAYHLACAMYLNRDYGEISFLTADRTQRSVAKKVGFRTTP